MNGAVANWRRRPDDKRRRLLVTPEGLALPLTLASRGARAGALLLDLLFIFGGVIAFFLLLGAIGLGLFNVEQVENAGPLFEFIAVLVLLLFLTRYGYFLWFELGPRAATPGKRLVGIRVAARPVEGQAAPRLTAEAVIARNLLRDIEVFLPVFFIFGGGAEAGIAGGAAAVWLLVFLMIPLFNRDRLRAGDIVAGTWVVEEQKAKLPQALSLSPPAARTEYRFGEAELAVYGEHELQVLETVLRQGDPQALREVMEAICRKIGWDAGAADEREFLAAFYAALRAHLERGLRFGKRKPDKFSRS